MLTKLFESSQFRRRLSPRVRAHPSEVRAPLPVVPMHARSAHLLQRSRLNVAAAFFAEVTRLTLTAARFAVRAPV